jgi:hypothetical protein
MKFGNTHLRSPTRITLRGIRCDYTNCGSMIVMLMLRQQPHSVRFGDPSGVSTRRLELKCPADLLGHVHSFRMPVENSQFDDLICMVSSIQSCAGAPALPRVAVA